ncbi:MFS transporter, SP family, sugar:H+ symporter [Cladophialophora psammophila CBS 110553]|uniref:MFS transporter, SP family, sugar:H+ symporter n=1 Tax=Cladophialophora psammophila CBS 110553 TaxID=1182543 RepID=W9W067_9EURO|nr:MFS transporter, SP family, sugar:H+ symporter [Cladophialophora psammophila CBS 110553]EXJ61482.1 MFS transporter, SP family, sugar:H+ symporter [Cladophialophora psammophila CBS 110553]
MGIAFVWAFILGGGILLFPDTPRYLYRHGHKEEAKKIMEKVYGAPPNHYSVHIELEEIEAKLRAEVNEGNPIVEWFRMFRAPKMAHRIVLGMTLQMFQQLTGANYFFYYGTVILIPVILNGINFGTTFYDLYVVEHYGRRKSLMIGSAWMFLMFLMFANVGHFSLDKHDPQKTESSGTAMIVMASFFIAAFSSTLGPIVWTITGEVYPSKYRARSMALSTASNWLWNFLIAFFTPFITGDIDFLYGYVFAGCNLVAIPLVYFFVIEGQGRTLEEIDTMYILSVKPWKSSECVAPPPEELAKIRREAGTDDTAEAGEITPAGQRSSDETNTEKEAEKDVELHA